MPLNVKRLRTWFAAAAITVAVIVVAFYLAGVVRARRAAKAGSKLGANVEQSTQGFTLSKSEGGRTLFSVHASKAVQYKQGGRAELHDVSIVVYGRESNRFDQIYGADFEYDPQTGDIRAQGDVQIDLEANNQGPVNPDQAMPAELQNPIHLKTSGLEFNQQTGIAQTAQRVEFRLPQASGSAVGAVYDAKRNTLTLDSQVRLQTVDGTIIQAQHGVLGQKSRQAVLTTAKLQVPGKASAGAAGKGGEIEADKLTAFLRDDNSIGRMLAEGDVRGNSSGPNPVRVRAPQAEFFMGARDQLRSAVISGGVSFEQGGSSQATGTAGRATLDFGSSNELLRITASDGLKFLQTPKPASGQQAQTIQLDADGGVLRMAHGRPERAETAGAAQITIRPQPPAATQGGTKVTAARFEMAFDRRSGRISTLHGEPDARIVSSVPRQADRVSTSRALDARFDVATGQIAEVLQTGNVHYGDGQRTASAEQARYNPVTTDLVLTGGPRFSDGGITTTARVLSFNQHTGDAAAQGEVKTTYNDLKPQPGGAMLATADPVHVTAASMAAARVTSVATYSGSARLWQGANVVEAPAITFDRDQRSMVAQGSAGKRVSTVFIQTSQQGNVTPVNVTAERLTYSDPQRTARFEGGVVLRAAETTITAREATVLLAAAGVKSRVKAPGSGSQIDRVVAQGDVQIHEPSRRAAGEQLVYTASDGKYVLTGGTPSIFDAEHGSIRGDSLTFYSRDDRVLVGSANSTRTVTQTKIAK